MKKLFKRAVLAIILLASGAACAVDPVPGIYAGIMFGPSYAPDIDFTLINPLTGIPTQGDISPSVLGNFAGQVGYRIKHFRMEGELFIDYNPYKSLEFDNITVQKTGKFTTGLGMKGQTTALAFMLNGFYDFYSTNELSYFSPYLGLGIGYASIKNSVQFYFNDVSIPGASISDTSNTPVAQLIIGAGYFVDDFTSVGLDYRYLTSTGLQAPFDTRFQLNSINLTINGSFDRS